LHPTATERRGRRLKRRVLDPNSSEPTIRTNPGSFRAITAIPPHIAESRSKVCRLTVEIPRPPKFPESWYPSPSVTLSTVHAYRIEAYVGVRSWALDAALTTIAQVSDLRNASIR